MTVLGIALTVLCGVTALISATGKLTRQEPVMAILDHVGVRGPLRTLLPYLQLAGGVAALVSLVVLPWLGVVALVCLALYFAGAVVFHVRVGDGLAGYGIPLGVAVVMAVAATVRALTI